MEKPVEPQEPGDSVEEKDMLLSALAVAVAAIKAKCPKVMITESEVYTWSQRSGTLRIQIGSKEEWKAYDEARKKYKQDLIAWEADQHGVSVVVYEAAKDKYTASRGCEKGKDKDLDYYIQRELLGEPEEIIEE